MPAPLVELDDVRLTLPSDAGPVDILRGVSLAIQAGEIVGIVGPSGSGKSTLMMITAGVERATSGRVAVDGQDMTKLSEDQLARLRRDRIAIVFQNFHLIPTMTAVENVAVPLELAGRRDAFALAEQALTDVGLGHRLTHRPGQLSGGEQQRVALARALAPQPRLILADEPTGNLDRETGERVSALLFDLARRSGTALALITHDETLAERCDRIVRIGDGRIVSERPGRMPARAAA